ncbi:MAG: chemotaxis response regulator protein-glutamate methylesterase [Oscillospiraceae bacterium]
MEIRKIRVLVVDDSLLFRETLARQLGLDPRIEVIGTAVDAFDAMEKIKRLNPDVVSLDVEMPKMDGIAFLKKLMPQHPVKVVVVTSLPINAFEAMDAGAVDFVRKPGTTPGLNDMGAFIRELISKIKVASIASVKNVSRPNLAPLGLLPKIKANVDRSLVIALGASTGGTEAILSVIKDLPVTTPGIVIVQHMPPVFTKMYAERLDKICHMEVKEAENGDRVQAGRIIIGAGGFHLTLQKDVKGYYVKSAAGEKVSGHCPSVDVLFDSVSKIAQGNKTMGIIMTGMGSDGAKGLLSMRKKGAYTVGQDKETCVVYGMPMVAFNIGSVEKQYALNDIPASIINWVNKR